MSMEADPYLRFLSRDGGTLGLGIHALVFQKGCCGGGVDGRYGGAIREVTFGNGKRHCV